MTSNQCDHMEILTMTSDAIENILREWVIFMSENLVFILDSIIQKRMPDVYRQI